MTGNKSGKVAEEVKESAPVQQQTITPKLKASGLGGLTAAGSGIKKASAKKIAKII